MFRMGGLVTAPLVAIPLSAMTRTNPMAGSGFSSGPAATVSTEYAAELLVRRRQAGLSEDGGHAYGGSPSGCSIRQVSIMILIAAAVLGGAVGLPLLLLHLLGKF